MNQFLLFALTLHSFLFLIVDGQLSKRTADSLGNDFIFSFLRNYEGQVPEVQLHMRAPEDFKNGLEVNIEYPVGTFYESTRLFSNNITIVNLPEESSMGWSPNSVQRNSIRVFSSDLTKEFVVYMINYSEHTSDAALALPIDALNTRYIVLDYYPVVPALPAELVVTAPYDDTLVTITPTTEFGDYSPSVPLSVSLSRGESYYLSASSSFSGTLIQATRPITMTNGVRCANVPVNKEPCDHIFEVAQPVQSWGKRSIAAPLPQRSGGSLYRIVASENNTTVTVYSGSNEEPELIGLNLGEFSERLLRGPVIAQSDKPAFMVQFMTSDSNFGAVDGDPAMGNVISVDQYLREYTFSTIRNKYNVNYVSIIAHTADLGSFILDGNPLGGDSFSAIAGDEDWHWAVIEIAEGTHTTKSTNEGHGITVEGFLEADSYLYPGGAQFEIINKAGDTETPLCSVLDLTDDGTILFEARDNGSGLLWIDLNKPSDKVSLEVSPSFSPGDAVVNFTVSLIGGIDADDDVREVFAVAVDGAGNRCNFPRIGEILPTPVPSTRPTAAPSPKPIGLSTPEPSSGDTQNPLCFVRSFDENSPTSTVFLEARDSGAGISAINLNRLADNNVLLEVDPSFSPGDSAVNFSLSFAIEDGASVRDIHAIVGDGAGNQCTFPSIGDILDSACIEDEECVGDSGFAIPVADQTNISFAQDWKVLSHPSYATLKFNETHVLYFPEWSGIEYDAFAISGNTTYGDTFILVVEYVASNQTIDFSIDVVGQWFDYYWTLEESYDSDHNRTRALRKKGSKRPAGDPEWHHELPQSLFAPKKGVPKYQIDGLDRNFINQPKFGVLLKWEDHTKTGAPIGAKAYNTLFKAEMDKFIATNNGKLPTTTQVVNDVLPRPEALSNTAYDTWDNSKGKDLKIKVKESLQQHTENRAKRLAQLKPRSALKIAKKIGKVIPGVGRFVTAISIVQRLWDGEAAADVLKDEGQDAIPLWGELRAVYSILDGLGIIDRTLILDATYIADEAWKRLKFGLGLGVGLDQNGNSYARAYLDPHFRTWHGTHFAYHGVCDMVYLKNRLVEIHIRTAGRGRGTWSRIEGVALRIGSDTLEYSEGRYYVNGTETAELPELVGGSSFPLRQAKEGFTILLSGGQYIGIRRRYNTVVTINAHGSDFFDSAGLTGTWIKPGFVARDGNLTFEDPQSFAREWEVNQTIGDPILFQTPVPNVCESSPLQIVEPDPARRQLAETVCGYIEDSDLRSECIFDVATTGDVSLAEDEVYAKPWVEESQCYASSEDCTLLGGTCTWRCNTEASNCEPGLCQLVQSVDIFDTTELSASVVEGCSCSIPFRPPTNEPSSPSEAPSTEPSKAPSFEPSKGPSVEPSEGPSLKPSEGPSVKPSEAPSFETSETRPPSTSSSNTCFPNGVIRACAVLVVLVCFLA